MLRVVDLSCELDTCFEFVKEVQLDLYLRYIFLLYTTAPKVNVSTFTFIISSESRKGVRTSTQTPHQRTHDPPLVRRTHQQTEPLPLRTRRSTISMNIHICGSWNLVMNDVVYVGDVESTSGDVCCEEDCVFG